MSIILIIVGIIAFLIFQLILVGELITISVIPLGICVLGIVGYFIGNNYYLYPCSIVAFVLMLLCALIFIMLTKYKGDTKRRIVCWLTFIIVSLLGISVAISDYLCRDFISTTCFVACCQSAVVMDYILYMLRKGFKGHN